MSTDDPVRTDAESADGDPRDLSPYAAAEAELLPLLIKAPQLALEAARLALDPRLVPVFTNPKWFTASGQGRVCRATDDFLKREVAVKLAGNAADAVTFEQEARVTAQLNHEHIVPLHYFGLVEVEGEPGPALAIVTKLIGRRTLAEAIRDEVYFSDDAGLRAAVELVAQVADALEHAHERQVIHRDVKPGNIFLEENAGRVVAKLGDFGIIKLMDEPPAQGACPAVEPVPEAVGLTVEGAFRGTEEYAAPEQRRGERVDKRVDLFSLGMVLYEVITGRRAFTKDQLRGEQPQVPSPPRHSRTASDKRLDAICAKALAWEPGARYQSAAAFRDDLRAWISNMPLPTLKTSIGRRAWLYFKREPLRAVVMGAVAAICALSVTVFVLRWLHADRLRREDCARSLALAEREESVGKMREAEARLAQSCQEQGLRGWEWSYLRRRAHEDPRVLRGRQGLLFGAAFHPTGDGTLATAGLDGLVTLWDPVRGQPRRAPLLAERPVAERTPLRAAAFSPDGATFAAVGGGPHAGGAAAPPPGAPLGEILIWDTATWTLRRRIALDQNAWSVAFSPDGKTVVTGCGLLARKSEGSVQLHDVATGALLRRVAMPTRSFAVAYHRSGTIVAAGGEDSRIRLLDPATGRDVAPPLVASDRLGRIVRGLTFSQDGQRLAAGAGAASSFDTGDLRVWTVAGWRQELNADGIGDHDGHADEVGAVAFSPDGTRLASGGFDRTVRIWDLERRRETLALRQHTDIVRAVGFNARGDLLASVGEDGAAVIWDARPPEHSPRALIASHDGTVRRMAFTAARGGIVALSGEDRGGGSDAAQRPAHSVKVLAAAGGPVVRTLGGQTDIVAALALSGDGRWLASGSYDGTVRLWDLPSGTEPILFGDKGTSWLNGVALDPGGRRLAVARNYVVEVWDVRSRQRSVLAGHEWLVSSLAFHPIRNLLVTGSWDQTARIWDLDRPGTFVSLQGHHGRINAVAFSPDGMTVVTASNDATLRTWSLDGKALATFVGHEDAVLDAALSPDGRWLASAGQDQTVRVWDVQRGLLKEVLRGHASRVRGVTFGATPRELLVAVGDERGGGFERLTVADR